MDLNFVPRRELSDCEWDRQDKRWRRPEIDPQILKELSARSTLNGLARVGLTFLMLFATAAITLIVAQQSVWLAIVPYYLYCFIYGFLIAIEHEMRHKVVLARAYDRLSDAIYFVIHALLRSGPRRERISHRIHHRYTMVKGVDPETEYPDPPTTRWLKRRLLRRLLDILFVGAILTALQSVWHLVRLAAGWQDKLMREQCAAKDVRVMRREAIAILLIQVAVIGGALWFRRWEPILFVSLATSVGGAMVGFYNDTQHIGLMYNTNDQRLSTRSVRCGPFVHLLFWGLDDHIEHHDFPSVPSRNLPRLRRLLNQEIPEAKSLVACWQEIFAIAREKEQHPDHVFAPPPIASPQIGQLSQARGEME